MTETPSSILSFMDAFRDLPHRAKDDAECQSLKQDILHGFHDHEQMAISLVKSSLLAALARHGSDDVHKAMDSRWRKTRVTPLRVKPDDPPIGVSVKIVFVTEHTEHGDATDEVLDILHDDIVEHNYDCFILQLVVNDKHIRF